MQTNMIGDDYRQKYRELEDLRRRHALINASMSIHLLIERLQIIAQAHPNARIVQRFHCSDGDSYLDTPILDMNPTDAENVFVLGE